MTRHYVHMIDPADLAELCDDDLGVDESCALDVLADKEFLARVLLRLRPREERVIRLRFGLGGVGEHTLREIGEEFGIGPQAVRNVEMKALRRLRWHAVRAFPERAQRMTRKVLPELEPRPRLSNPRPKRSSTASGSRSGTAHGVRAFEATPVYRLRPAPPAPVPPVRPLISGWLLSVVAGLYLAALGLNSTVTYQVAAALGSALSLLLCVGLGLLSGIFSLTLLAGPEAWVDAGDPAGRRLALRFVLAAPVAGIAGLLAPVQHFLIDLVAATPIRFRTPTPEIVQLFSWAILLLCPVYLRGYWLRERNAHN